MQLQRVCCTSGSAGCLFTELTKVLGQFRVASICFWLQCQVQNEGSTVLKLSCTTHSSVPSVFTLAIEPRLNTAVTGLALYAAEGKRSLVLPKVYLVLTATMQKDLARSQSGPCFLEGLFLVNKPSLRWVGQAELAEAGQ